MTATAAALVRDAGAHYPHEEFQVTDQRGRRFLRIEPQPRQDAEGRFDLNDLHRAFGCDPGHAPSLFLRDAHTRGLIEALGEQDASDDDSVDPVEVSYGHGGGTFVAWELVYAYAGWVDPMFMLKMLSEAMDDQALGEMLDEMGLAAGGLVSSSRAGR